MNLLKSLSEKANPSFENLRRLGLCDRGKNILYNINMVNNIFFTDYGWSFINSCMKVRDQNRALSDSEWDVLLQNMPAYHFDGRDGNREAE